MKSKQTPAERWLEAQKRQASGNSLTLKVSAYSVGPFDHDADPRDIAIEPGECSSRPSAQLLTVCGIRSGILRSLCGIRRKDSARCT